MNVADVRPRVEQFILRTAYLIDNDRLEDWLDCFDATSSYHVVPRDNHVRGLPGALMHCDNKARLVDRVTCLRTANKINPHYDRHIMSGALVTAFAEDLATVESNFMIVQTNLSGASKMFCAGCYYDKLRIDSAGTDKIVERRVVLDTFSVPTMLATPL